VELDDLDRHRIRERIAPELEQEALLDVARRHARRVEALDEREDLPDLLGGDRAPLRELLELGGR
jgi:hypothetical protein